jgi:hypothetical protein
VSHDDLLYRLLRPAATAASFRPAPASSRSPRRPPSFAQASDPAGCRFSLRVESSPYRWDWTSTRGRLAAHRHRAGARQRLDQELGQHLLRRLATALLESLAQFDGDRAEAHTGAVTAGGLRVFDASHRAGRAVRNHGGPSLSTGLPSRRFEHVQLDSAVWAAPKKLARGSSRHRRGGLGAHAGRGREDGQDTTRRRRHRRPHRSSGLSDRLARTCTAGGGCRSPASVRDRPTDAFSNSG